MRVRQVRVQKYYYTVDQLKWIRQRKTSAVRRNNTNNVLTRISRSKITLKTTQRSLCVHLCKRLGWRVLTLRLYSEFLSYSVQNSIAKILLASFLIRQSAMNLLICLSFCKRVNTIRVSSRRLQFSCFKSRQRKWCHRVMINYLKGWCSPVMIQLLKVRLWLQSLGVLQRVHLICMRCKVTSE